MADRLLLEIKAASDTDEGRFDGILSTYGNVDRVGDICEKGCFDGSVADRPRFPLLWQHDEKEPIGSFEVVETDPALRIAGRINLKTSRGRDAHALLLAGDVTGLSIGYVASKADYDDQGVRHLKEVELIEGSLVTVPANPMATVREAKGMDIEQIEKSIEELTEEQRQALLEKLGAAGGEKAADAEQVPGNGLTEEEADVYAQLVELRQQVTALAEELRNMRQTQGDE